MSKPSLWVPPDKQKKAAGWHPGEMVRIIGIDNQGAPITVLRPHQYDLKKFYPDNEPRPR